MSLTKSSKSSLKVAMNFEVLPLVTSSSSLLYLSFPVILSMSSFLGSHFFNQPGVRLSYAFLRMKIPTFRKFILASKSSARSNTSFRVLMSLSSAYNILSIIVSLVES